MLTIGITFWEKDYQLFDSVISQINEKVKVPFELIVIDNTEGNKLGDKATFAFGYNAHQFAARYKIIKLAKGDYIWFVDGDDEVLEIDDTLFAEPFDMLCASYISRGLTKTLQVQEWNNDDHWGLMQNDISQALWNKIIKTEMFDNIDDYVDNPLLNVCSLEDTFYVAVALKNANTVLSTDKVIYKHNQGYSDATAIDNSGFENLVTGFNDILVLFDKLGYDTERIKQHHFEYFLMFVGQSENPGFVLGKILELFKEKEYWDKNYYRIIMNFHRKADYDWFKGAFIERFGEVPKMCCIEELDDGTTKEIYFESIPEYND